MQLFDFRCHTCDHVFEDWDTSDRSAKPACPSCGSSDTHRLIATPRMDLARSVANGEASSDGMTTAIDKWDRARRQKMKIEQRNLERHGTYD